LKVGGLLHPRKLAHFIQETLNASGPCDDWKAPGWDKNLLSGYDYDCSDTVTRDVVIPLAIAASVAVISEGTQEDNSGYYALATSLSQFEKVPTTETLSSNLVAANSQLFSLQSNAPTVPELDPYDTLALKYVDTQQRATDAKTAFLANQINIGQFLQIIFEERARGRALDSGIALDSAALTKIAKAEIDTMKATGQFFEDGSLPKLAQAKACAQLPAAAANQLSQAAIANLQATCDGTKDSDGDGVPDLYDQCITSPGLLANGGTVGTDGCMYADSQALLLNTTPSNVNAMLVPWTRDAGTP
jgi:hypothetical protein